MVRWTMPVSGWPPAMVTSARILALSVITLVAQTSGGRSASPFAPPAAMDVSQTTECVQGRTFRWTWTEGPTAGVTHQHDFLDDGSVSWRVLSGPQQGHAGVERAYSAFTVSQGVCVVSYLASSGFTLTVALNMTSGEMYGFASNDEVWFPGRGTFEVVP